MESSTSPQDSLTAARFGKTAVIRVSGRGSFKISPPLKQYIQRLLEKGEANRILIDMADCIGMDSTFMGVLAGLSALARSRPGTSLRLVNLSEKNRQLLATLGVDRVVSFSSDATEEEQRLIEQGRGSEGGTLEHDPADKLGAARTTLEAHENLVELHPENQARFKSVLELLRNDVQTLSQNRSQ